MRVVIGVVFTAIMGCVFTLMTVVIFVTQHLFASWCWPACSPLPWVRRCADAGRGAHSLARDYPAGMAGAQLPPASRWAAPEMSSAALRPRRC